MIKVLLLINLFLFLNLFGQAQGATTVQFTVIDEQNKPISGVTYVVRLGDSQETFTSGPDGETIVTLPDAVQALFIESAAHGRRDLLLDQNMPDGTIRIASIPGQQRPVVLFVDRDGMLHMTPESLFAGIEPTTGLPSTVVPAVDGSMPALPTSMAFQATAIAAQTQTLPEAAATNVAAAPVMPTQPPVAGAAPQAAAGSAGLPMWCWVVSGVALLLVAVVAIAIVRRERQRNQVVLDSYQSGQPTEPDEK